MPGWKAKSSCVLVRKATPQCDQWVILEKVIFPGILWINTTDPNTRTFFMVDDILNCMFSKEIKVYWFNWRTFITDMPTVIHTIILIYIKTIIKEILSRLHVFFPDIAIILAWQEAAQIKTLHNFFPKSIPYLTTVTWKRFPHCEGNRR